MRSSSAIAWAVIDGILDANPGKFLARLPLLVFTPCPRAAQCHENEDDDDADRLPNSSPLSSPLLVQPIPVCAVPMPLLSRLL